MFHRRPSAPRGWELAPSVVEQEVMVLWQEEDMPAELKAAPGYVPFTVSPETQAWIDSMLEVREVIQGEEHHVAGRPRPRDAQPVHHITSAPPPPPQPTPVYTPPRSHPAPAYDTQAHTPPREAVPTPAPPPAPPPPPAMPEITLGRSLKITRRPSPPLAHTTDEGPVMPDIGSGGTAVRPRNDDDEALMPEIDT